MAQIIKTLKLRTRFEIVKVEMDAPDLYSDEDYKLVEEYVESNPCYTNFRYLTGLLRSSDSHYFTFYLCSLDPRKRVSDKDMDMIKDIIEFSQL